MVNVHFSWIDESAPGARQQKVVTADETASVLQIAVSNDIPIEANCGGRGRCGKCKIKVSGPVSPLEEAERSVLTQRERDESVRLACRCYPQGDVSVEFTASSKIDILTSGVSTSSRLSPDVFTASVQVKVPTLEEPEADRNRLVTALESMEHGPVTVPLSLLRSLPGSIRQAESLQAICHHDTVLDVLPDSTEPIYGVAIDVGTTTVAAGLNNLLTGEEVAVAAAMNGQATYGADVIARIDQAAEPSVLAKLRRAVIATINGLVEELCSKAGVMPERIYRAVVVGNTCMQHLVLGVEPKYLAQSPYVPAFSEAVTYPADQVGLAIASSAPVTLLPSIAGFVGADTVGMILSADLGRLPGKHLAIDIGTNGEIVLATDGEMFSCSAAAGPAFEGGQILWGMRAAPGAVDRVDLVDGDIVVSTIQDQPAAGICGSGLIDLMAVLVRLGVIDTTGRLVSRGEVDLPSDIQTRLVDSDYGPAFVVADSAMAHGGEPVLFTHKDVRQVQLAKGAIQAGCRILADKAGIQLADLDTVYLAGAFGSYIRPESAVTIGLLPSDSLPKVQSLGNAARIGARMALLDQEQLVYSSTAARTVRYIELSASPEFQMEFMEAMMF